MIIKDEVFFDIKDKTGINVKANCGTNFTL